MNKRSILLDVSAVLIVAALVWAQRMSGWIPPVEGTAWSLLPPLVAIALALLTKEVYGALAAGLGVGALLHTGGSPGRALQKALIDGDGSVVSAIANPSHAAVLVFVVLLATFVVLLNRSGGAAAFGRWAERHVRGRAGAQLATIATGLLVFLDDGFNCMTVGSVMRPLTDSHRISRAKLAWLIDSTAAPVCIIAPVSCWAAAVSSSVPEGMDINGFRMFLHTIPYNLYALGTICMLVLAVLWQADIGPMRRSEAKAEREPPRDDGAGEPASPNGRLADLVLPVAVLVALCVAGIAWTGGFPKSRGLADAFANAESANGLVMGGTVAMGMALWYFTRRGVVGYRSFMEAFAAGFRSMCAPMIILILAWALSGMTGLLGAPEFVRRTVESSTSSLKALVPAVAFAVSVFIAFSTGTSWGTFSILIPIVCTLFPPDSEMLAISISACLAGAVCGDHCSPVSDTTIMSSAGAGCDHLEHVSTQLPYALITAAASAIGYLAAGFLGVVGNGRLALLSLPLTLALLAVALRVARRRGSVSA